MRTVYFGFHFQRDYWRVGQIRHSWINGRDKFATPFLDAADWEEVKRQGKQNIENWIQDQLQGSSVTVILIGNETSTRDWVNYEIVESHNRGNGLLGIYIHNMRDQRGYIDIQGANPFANHFYTNTDGIKRTYLSSIYPTYDWVYGNGRDNIGIWIENAARAAGR